MLRPMFHASDPDVRAWVTEQFQHIGPYAVADLVLTADEIIDAAYERFGKRAADLEFWVQ